MCVDESVDLCVSECLSVCVHFLLSLEATFAAPEIKSDEIRYGNEIGAGQYGKVFRCVICVMAMGDVWWGVICVMCDVC